MVKHLWKNKNLNLYDTNLAQCLYALYSRKYKTRIPFLHKSNLKKKKKKKINRVLPIEAMIMVEQNSGEFPCGIEIGPINSWSTISRIENEGCKGRVFRGQ